MSIVFSRGHRICRSTSFRLPLPNIPNRRHLQLDIVPAAESQLPSAIEVQESSLGPSSDSGSLVFNRIDRFNALYEFVKGGIGSRRAVPSRGVRNTAWNNLFMLAQTSTQLELVVEMLPRWREMQRSFRRTDAEVFVRRCQELNCPLLALRVFSNHPKYAFPLSTNLAGLQLIHSLHLLHPLQETITASALFKTNNLSPVTSSLPACAMLVSACFHNQGDPRAKELADTLLPLLQNLCAHTPVHMWLGSGLSWRFQFGDQPKVWTFHALRRIERALKKQGKGEEYAWIRKAMQKFRTEDQRIPFPALGSPQVSAIAAPVPDEGVAGP